MIRILTLVVLLAAPFASAQIQGWTSSDTALTAAEPSLATHGTTLVGAAGYRVIICAESGQTLTGGTLRFWLWDPYIVANGVWAYGEELDITITGGERCSSFERDTSMTTNLQRLYVQQSGITVSGGTTVTLRVVKGGEQ